MKNKLYKTRVYRGSTKGFTEYALGHSGGGRILGFVEHRTLTTTFDTKLDVVTIAPNRYCVKMEKVRGYFNLKPKLFMPTDYSRKSCEYQEILKHEKRHLNEIKKFHAEYSPRFEAHLGRLARTTPILPPASSPEEINQQMAYLNNYFINGFKEFEYKATQILANRQRKVDSPQEYRGVARRCDNW